jgi:YD repeat-containing protein
MKEENLTSVSLPQTSITNTGHTTTNIMYDEVGQFIQPTTTIGNTVWKSQAFISPTEPKGIGALGEIHTDEQGYRFVYTKEGWIQVVNVVGPGLWEQLHGTGKETEKGTKKKLKCF